MIVQASLYYLSVDMVPMISVNGLARLGYALSDETRSRALLALAEKPGYPAELADRFAVSRQSMSNHLACLRGCGLVVAVPEGRRHRYELADARLAEALASLRDVVLVADPGCATQPTETSVVTT